MPADMHCPSHLCPQVPTALAAWLRRRDSEKSAFLSKEDNARGFRLMTWASWTLNRREFLSYVCTVILYIIAR